MNRSPDQAATHMTQQAKRESRRKVNRKFLEIQGTINPLHTERFRKESLIRNDTDENFRPLRAEICHDVGFKSKEYLRESKAGVMSESELTGKSSLSALRPREWK